MRAALRSRLERLEVVVEPKKTQLFRSGYLKTLPADFVGERHVVIVKREPGASGNSEWCEFEERPGPAVDAQDLEERRTLQSRIIETEIRLSVGAEPKPTPVSCLALAGRFCKRSGSRACIHPDSRQATCLWHVQSHC